MKKISKWFCQDTQDQNNRSTGGGPLINTEITLTVFIFEWTAASMSNDSGNHVPRAMLEPRRKGW